MKKFYKLTKKSFKKYEASNIKELWDKVKAEGYTGLNIELGAEFKKSADDPNIFHAIFSTASVDRHGDIVEQNFKLKNYKKNPVYLDSHNYSSIAKILGKVTNLKSDRGLEGDIVFAVDANPLAKMARDLAEGGFLNASSIGFIPTKFDDSFEKILESELLEISAVSVPANPEALFDKKQYENEHNEDKGDDTPREQDGDSGDDTGGDSGNDTEQKADDSQETDKLADEVINTEIKKTAEQLIYEAVSSEVENKKKSLNKISEAIKEYRKEVVETGGSTKGDKLLVNKAVRELLEIKKNLN